MSYEQNRLVAPTVQPSRASKCASAVLFYHFKGMERRASDVTMLSFKRALIWSTRQSGLLPTMQWPAGLHPPSIPPRISFNLNQANKQKFKVRQPQRAARSKRPNTPSDGSKNNGIHTTKQEEYPSRHPTTDTANKSPAGD